MTTFASGDSDVPGRLVPTVPVALRPADFKDDPDGVLPDPTIARGARQRSNDFDIIHSHLEWSSVLLARGTQKRTGRRPRSMAASTCHGHGKPRSPRLRPPSLVAISEYQASAHPDVDWAGIVHNGLTLDGAP